MYVTYNDVYILAGLHVFAWDSSNMCLPISAFRFYKRFIKLTPETGSCARLWSIYRDDDAICSKRSPRSLHPVILPAGRNRRICRSFILSVERCP